MPWQPVCQNDAAQPFGLWLGTIREMMTNNGFSVAKDGIALVNMDQLQRGESDRSNKAIDPNEKHLRTDHLLGDLKGRTISSGVITIAAQGIKFALNLVSIMVLARLL